MLQLMALSAVLLLSSIDYADTQAGRPTLFGGPQELRVDETDMLLLNVNNRLTVDINSLVDIMLNAYHRAPPPEVELGEIFELGNEVHGIYDRLVQPVLMLLYPSTSGGQPAVVVRPPAEPVMTTPWGGDYTWSTVPEPLVLMLMLSLAIYHAHARSHAKHLLHH